MSKFYGQRLEGIMVDEIIKSYFPEPYGVAIDVGAVDGIEINNTKHFEDLGWDVLCVEANPKYYSTLKTNRKYTMNYAISDVNQDDVIFHGVVLREQGNHSAISGLLIDERLIKQHNDMGFHCDQYEVKVNTRTLDFCLEQFNPKQIDFISIDIEGTELQALKGLNINKWQPKMFIIENNFNDPEIEEYLIPFGYTKVKRVGVNDFYFKTI